MSEGQSSEALSDLQSALSLPAPRALIAYVHLLSGSCLAHMVHIQNTQTNKLPYTLPGPDRFEHLQVLIVCVFICHQSRPQMALQCYRKALETDSCCGCALYQSMLIYRQLGNTQAEIQALRLLHSVSCLHIYFMNMAKKGMLFPCKIIQKYSFRSCI